MKATDRFGNPRKKRYQGAPPSGGRLMRDEIQRLGVSQKQCATLMGVGPWLIGDILNNRHHLNQEYAVRFAEAFKLVISTAFKNRMTEAGFPHDLIAEYLMAKEMEHWCWNVRCDLRLDHPKSAIERHDERTRLTYFEQYKEVRPNPHPFYARKAALQEVTPETEQESE